MWAAAFDTVRFDDAIDWFKRRTPITDEAFRSNAEQARRQAFWIAGVTQADVIRDVHESLKKALADGVPFETWKAEIGPKLSKSWLGEVANEGARTETIFRNWAQASYARARWDQMHEPSVLKFRPYLMFDGVEDSHQSKICKACNGVCLPAGHPWWATHRPPMHHRCRSGVRSLRKEQAEARGISKEPPATAAQAGFGDGEEWQGPDRAKYLKGAKPPKRPKAVAPAPAEPLPQRVAPPVPPRPPVAPPPPPPPAAKAPRRPKAAPAPAPSTPAPQQDVLSRNAGTLEQALQNPAEQGHEARRLLREHIAEALPGAVSKDIRDGLEGASVFGLDDGTLSAMGAEAYHDPLTGAVAARKYVYDDAARGVARSASGRAPMVQQAHAMRILIHEELHGFSRASATSTFGLGSMLEEVGTELNAQRIARKWSKVTQLQRAYEKDIVALRDAVGSALSGRNLTASQLEDMIADAHASQVLTSGPSFRGPKDHLAALVEGFPVSSSEKSAIRTAIEGLEKREEDD